MTSEMGVRTVQRAFQLLELMCEQQAPLRLREAVALTGFPQSSVADLLKTLSALGYLNFDNRSRSYFPTPKLASLGRMAEHAFEDAFVKSAVSELSEATGEAILLGTGHGLEVQYLEIVPSTHALQYVTTPGVRRPLIRAGVGFALLAGETRATMEGIYRKSSVIDRRRITLAELQRKIEECRRNGYVYSRNLVHEGVATVAAPVAGVAPLGRRLAIGITGPTERMDPMHAAYGRQLLKTLGRFSVRGERLRSG